jgi:hypothetical protein
VLPFGSFVTNLYLASSDVDLVVLNVAGGKKQVNSLLLALGNRLRAQGVAREVTMVPSARVPLLKYVDVASGLDVDVSLGLEDGVRSANFMKALGELYPAFRPLTLFLKAFMQARGLADVFRGGVSSYILQCMILFHLQVQELMHGRNNPADQRVSTFSPVPQSPTSNLGYLLFTFFELFGYTFVYEEHGMRLGDARATAAGSANGNSSNSGSSSSSISNSLPRGLDCYLKRSEGFGRFQPMRPWLMSLEDPIQHERDIGGACFGIRRVQRCFALAREFLCRMPEQPAAAAAMTQPSGKDLAKAADAASSFFVVDTVGDATSSSAAAASTAASSTSAIASPAAASSAPASGAGFSSSFGFLLQSLLDLPVRYSIAELERAARKQPAWLPVVDKLRRVEHLRAKKEEKNLRRMQREQVTLMATQAKVAKSAAAASAAAASSTPKSKPRASPTVDSTPIDLTSLGSTSPTITPARAPPPRASAAASVTDVDDDDDEDDDDSDIEILDGPRAPKPIPIDELDADEADDEAAAAADADADAAAAKASAEQSAAEEPDADTEDEAPLHANVDAATSAAGSDVPAAGAAAVSESAKDVAAMADAQNASVAAGSTVVASSPSSRHQSAAAADDDDDEGGDEDDDDDEEQGEEEEEGELPPIDGDALLASGEEDENMTLNLK